MIERMNRLIKVNMPLLRLMSKYANLTTEDIKQTAMCAYCFDPDIDTTYQSGDIKTASRLLRREYRKLIKNESFNPSVDRSARAERLIAKIESSYEDSYDIEKEIFCIPDEHILKSAREIVGDENYIFLLKYYDVGMHKCCDIYNLTESNCRVKAHRLIARIQSKIEL